MFFFKKGLENVPHCGIQDRIRWESAGHHLKIGDDWIYIIDGLGLKWPHVEFFREV